jgi:hypothetical protein
MKRVEGVSSRELLDDPERAGWQSLLVGHGARLRASVDILIAVSRAPRSPTIAASFIATRMPTM